MLTRRTFLTVGAGALAVTAAGGAAFAAPADGATDATPFVAIVSDSLRLEVQGAPRQVNLGTDRLTNLHDLRATLLAAEGRPVALALDAADHMLLDIAAADLAIRPLLISAGV